MTKHIAASFQNIINQVPRISVQVLTTTQSILERLKVIDEEDQIETDNET